MDQLAETLQNIDTSITVKQKISSRMPRKTMQKTRSFTDALQEKYCTHDESVGEFIIDIVIRGKPRNNGPTTAELAHLRNIVLSNRRVSTGGLPDNGLACLCPNVTDLDLSSNLFESWAELLPLLSQLAHLKFLNLSRNHVTRHKEVLLSWSTPLPKVENMVLNSTGIPLREVLALARLMPALRELHICCNYYRDLGSVELAVSDGALSKLECLRLNENIITSWAEVWKLRKLPSLTQIILSENPLCDVFYDPADAGLDSSLCEMDSPDITCHSDGEDSGSPRFRYPIKKSASSPKCRQRLSFQATDSQTMHDNNAVNDKVSQQESSENDANRIDGNWTTENSHCAQQDVVSDLLDDIISIAWERMSIEESCKQCQTTSRAEVDKTGTCISHVDLTRTGFAREDSTCANKVQNDKQNVAATKQVSEYDGYYTNHNDNHPMFYMEEDLDCLPDAEGTGATEAFGRYSHNKECNKEGAERRSTPCMEDNDAISTLPHAQGQEGETISTPLPFARLHTLCLSRTSICQLDHLHALNEFPQLEALRIMDIALFSEQHQEDRRKLYIASLPKVTMLNGSEVTATERDKAERYYLRHFVDREEKTALYEQLEKKHGPVTPLYDIDLGARFQKEVNLTFMLNGVQKFSQTVSVLQPVGKLRSFIAQKLAIPRTSFRMYHFACGPIQALEDKSFDELFLDSLPLSRFDFMDGDELHVEFMTEESASPILSFSKKDIYF